MVTIRRVVTKKDWQEFIDLPFHLYDRSSPWVPPLRIQVKDTLDINKNPFFRHASMAAFLAIRDGKIVGRVAASQDENYNRFHSEKAAFFGYFESIDDQEVANILLKAAEDWARQAGAEFIRGPINLSTNNECGLLIEGFEHPPVVMMLYNHPYYSKLLESRGYTKAKDLYAYELTDKQTKVSDVMRAHAQKLLTTAGVTFRTLRMSEFNKELERVFEVYNDAWEKNWGFVPMNEDELKHLVKELKPIIDPRLVHFAEVNGKPIGFVFGLPDINLVLKKIGDGKLFPTGLVKLLWGLKGPPRKKLQSMRIITLGVKKEYQPMGLGALLYLKCVELFQEAGFRRAEASWILEDNVPMNKALRRLAAERQKVYRLYDRSLRSSS